MTISTIDLDFDVTDEQETATAARRVGEAFRSNGYFELQTRRLEPQLVQEVYGEMSAFYGLDGEEKEGFRATSGSQYLGYRGVGRERSRQHSGAEVCEQYRIGDVDAVQVLEPSAAHFERPFSAGRRLFDVMTQISDEIMSLVIRDIDGGAGEHLRAPFDRTTHRIGFNLYGVQHVQGVQNSVSYAMSPHVDLSTFTILLQDSEGLRIQQPDDEWVETPVGGARAMVILGDYLARWTNDVYRGVPHMVVAVPRDRSSIQYKYRPSFGTVVEPLAPFLGRRVDGDREAFSTGAEYVAVLKGILGD